jgi:hypothetical protein
MKTIKAKINVELTVELKQETPGAYMGKIIDSIERNLLDVKKQSIDTSYEVLPD